MEYYNTTTLRVKSRLISNKISLGTGYTECLAATYFPASDIICYLSWKKAFPYNNHAAEVTPRIEVMMARSRFPS